MKTFVDTGGWLAVIVQPDQYHEVGVLHYEALIRRRERLFTSDYVLDETVTRIRYDASHATVVAFLDVIAEAERSGALHILHVDNAVWQAAEVLFRQYHDQDFPSLIAPVLCLCSRQERTKYLDLTSISSCSASM